MGRINSPLTNEILAQTNSQEYYETIHASGNSFDLSRKHHAYEQARP